MNKFKNNPAKKAKTINLSQSTRSTAISLKLDVIFAQVKIKS